MANPPLVEVWRDGLLESLHRGLYAIMDARGTVLASAGDIDRPVFPRSAYKTLQALPLIESGAADAFALSGAELSVACASHHGGAVHVATVGAWLRRIGRTHRDLECGGQDPRDPLERNRLIRRGMAPGTLHNNCSGKHAGFVTLADHLGVSPVGYTRADHPVQQLVTRAISELCDVPADAFAVAVDGCSAPNLGMPLRQYGLGVARCAARQGLTPERVRALDRLFNAQGAFPDLVAGVGGLDTALIAAGRGRLITKVGAEGVYAAFLLDRGLGVVLKIDDGAERAAKSALCEILVRLGAVPADSPAIAPHHRPTLRNWRGLTTGALRPHSDAFSWMIP